MSLRSSLAWLLIFVGAVAWLLTTPTLDPAAPAYVYAEPEPALTPPLRIPAGDLQVVDPEAVTFTIFCDSGETLADDGRGCVPLPESPPEDLSPAPAPVPDANPVVDVWEDGSYRRADGTGGCYWWGLCND